MFISFIIQPHDNLVRGSLELKCDLLFELKQSDKINADIHGEATDNLFKLTMNEMKRVAALIRSNEPTDKSLIN